jgi:hypothetical protein
MKIVPPHRLGQLLIAQGLVPANCRVLNVEFRVMEAAILRYEVFVTGDDLVKLAQAFTAAVVEQTDGENQTPGPPDAR